MKILFVTGEPPWPLHGGARIRAYHLQRGLAREHEVHLLCCASARQAVDLQRALGDTCSGIITVEEPAARPSWMRVWETATTPMPDLSLRYDDDRVVHGLREALGAGGFDLVHITGLEMVRPVLRAMSGRRYHPRPRLVLDAQNAEHLLQRRAVRVGDDGISGSPIALYSWVQARKLARYEHGLGSRLDGIIAVSEQDRTAFLRLGLRLPIEVVPNGVDTEAYRPPASPRRSPTGAHLPAPRLLFTGTMDYRPNVDAVCWFVERILPRILDRHPQAVFDVAGRRPSERIAALGGPHVAIHGEVEDDTPFFERAAAFVLPMRFGGGSRLKLLQALAAGSPVVTTTCGAEGVRVADGRDVLVRDDPVEFADAAASVIEDRLLAFRLGAEARTTALRYDWSAIVPGLLDFYRRLHVRRITVAR
ncbi:MAG: glycosyltransferase [Dehalococcoidia bacterium]|nr:glycosyltransferase [Dehalococcoidia bacterium]